MLIMRKWVTPLTIGTAILVTVTGILMFFHMRFGLNTMAHEWIGLLFAIAVILHIYINFKPFKKHLKTKTGAAIVCIFLLVLGLSFISWTTPAEPKETGKKTIQTLINTPIELLAPIGKKSTQAALAEIRMPSANPQSTPLELAKHSRHKAVAITNQVINR